MIKRKLSQLDNPVSRGLKTKPLVRNKIVPDIKTCQEFLPKVLIWCDCLNNILNVFIVDSLFYNIIIRLKACWGQVTVLFVPLTVFKAIISQQTTCLNFYILISMGGICFLFPTILHTTILHLKKKVTFITGFLTSKTSKSLPAHRTNASFFTSNPVSPAVCFPVFPSLQILFAFLKLSLKTHLLLQVSNVVEGEIGGVGRRSQKVRSLVFWCLTQQLRLRARH